MKSTTAIFNIVFITFACIFSYPFVKSWWEAEMVKTKYSELPVRQRDIVKAVDEINQLELDNQNLVITFQDSIKFIKSEAEKALKAIDVAWEEAFANKLDTIVIKMSNKIQEKNAHITELKKNDALLKAGYKKLQKKNTQIEQKLKKSYKRVVRLYKDSIKHSRPNIAK